MAAKHLMKVTVGAAVLVCLASTAQTAAATTIYDDRPIIVRPAHPGWRWRECPTCYKGYDFGQDCFQRVWTGFEEIRANVCLWGWN
ncbi:MAG TPA: hypothetical protein VEH76_10755 [Methylocystis sp.]|nr:hypothetical protein [Methylocystis sp.]